MKGVERMNTVIVNLNQQAELVLRCDLYTTDIDCRRNCYSCKDFGYLVRNYRNWRIVE